MRDGRGAGRELGSAARGEALGGGRRRDAGGGGGDHLESRTCGESSSLVALIASREAARAVRATTRREGVAALRGSECESDGGEFVRAECVRACVRRVRVLSCGGELSASRYVERQTGKFDGCPTRPPDRSF